MRSHARCSGRNWEATALLPRQNLDIMDVFNLPERLDVFADPDFRRRVRCCLGGYG